MLRLIEVMLQVILLVAAGWLLVGVASLRNVSQTPGVKAAETLIQPPLYLCCLEELAEKLQLNPPYELKIIGRTRLNNGCCRVKLAISYNDVAVRGYYLTATQRKDGCYTGAVSGYIPDVTGVNTEPSISLDVQTQLLIDYVNDANLRYDVEDACSKDLVDVTSVKQIFVDQETGTPTVGYFIRAGLYTDVLFRWPRALIDAKARNVIQGSVEVSLYNDQFIDDGVNEGDDQNYDVDLKDSQKLCPKFKGGNIRCPRPNFGPGPNEVCLNATVDGSYTVLASDRVVVYTLGNGVYKNDAKVVRFKTDKGPDDAVNDAYAPSEDAFRCATKALDLLQEWGNETLDSPKPLIVYTHAGVSFSNSFYDGSAIVLGDGMDILLPLTQCEVVGHEIGHVVIDSLRNLAMRDESRGVAEGFCDIFAKSLSAYLQPHGKVDDWIFGACVVREGNQKIRFYDDPSKDGFGIDNLSVYNTTNAAYRALGIITKSFYCLVAEKGMLVKDVFRAFVFANKMYWDENTGFVDAACGVYRAASDLQLNTNNFFGCFNGVGIDLTFCSLEGT